LIPLASNCAISDKKRALIGSMLRATQSIAILVADGEKARQIAIGAKKDQRTFRPKCVQSNRYWLASGDLRVRAVTVKSVKLRSGPHPATSGIEYILPDQTTHHTFIVNAIQRLQFITLGRRT
jgi:uncharacterized membrane-anchored protein